ncbi:MAG: aminotransferase class V-fold PLP-dependent enzyme [Deferribacteres bacterium]|nr:aminotransferase class V-fold PLP-dependent enzyme [Deferribacteres bacterium]
MYKKIHLDAPNIGELEKLYLNRAIDSGYVSSAGPWVSGLEEKCAAYLHTAKAVATNSGTSALHIALHELGIGKGDEVIVPALTFIATVNPVVYAGATPVFADVDIRTWNMDPRAVEDAVTDKTRAVIPVHLYGNPCDMDEINRIARKYGLHVIEDAAESLGARYRGVFTGTLGDLGCFSLNGNKTITAGGGGIVTGNDVQRLNHIKFLINQARGEQGYHTEIGFNYRMTNLQAAVGLAQFERLEEFLAKKRAFNKAYRDALGHINGIRFQEEYKGAESSYWFTCIIVEDASVRRELQEGLKDRGIPTRRLFPPVSELPPYRGCRFIDRGNSRYIYERGICLPCSTLNNPEDIEYVCRALSEFYYEGSFVYAPVK